MLLNKSLSPLTTFGLFAVSAMLVCYALEDRSPWFVLGFAGACLLGSAYGFLQGAWPFGLVEGIWSLVALRRWWRTRKARRLYMDSKTHWETIYKAKAPTEVSWYQERPSKSLELIDATGIGREGMLIDVGGGASTLVDCLLSDGFRRITILDISQEAIRKAKSRLGARADSVTWMEGDITQVILPYRFYDLWHDRAVFHFLTSPEDRRRYLKTLNDALSPEAM